MNGEFPRWYQRKGHWQTKNSNNCRVDLALSISLLCCLLPYPTPMSLLLRPLPYCPIATGRSKCSFDPVSKLGAHTEQKSCRVHLVSLSTQGIICNTRKTRIHTSKQSNTQSLSQNLWQGVINRVPKSDLSLWDMIDPTLNSLKVCGNPTRPTVDGRNYAPL